MDRKLNYKSKMKLYWVSLLGLFIAVILVNLLLVKEFKNFSFEFYFLLMIPLWVGVLGINGYESGKLKIAFREYLESYYPEKIQAYDNKPVELLNSDSEGILDLTQDELFKEDTIVTSIALESKNITNFMYFVFIAMPILLFLVVFLILK